MTKEQYRKDEHAAVFKRDNYCCRICGASVNDKHASAAHLIKQSKENIRDYGWYVIYSRHIQWCTCSNECNDIAELRAKHEGKQAIDDMLLVIGMTVKKQGLPVGKVLERKLK